MIKEVHLPSHGGSDWMKEQRVLVFQQLNLLFNEGFEVKAHFAGLYGQYPITLLLHKPDSETDPKARYPQCPSCGGHHDVRGGCLFEAEDAQL
jgi:hypothetical protein